MSRPRAGRRTMRRRVLVGAAQIVVTIAFLIVMINVVQPWAAETLSADFVRQIKAP